MVILPLVPFNNYLSRASSSISILLLRFFDYLSRAPVYPGSVPGTESRIAVLLLLDRTSWMVSRRVFDERSMSRLRATLAPMLASMEGVPFLKAVAR